MNNGDCPLQKEETADLLLDYSARRLDGAKTAMLERHMENCPACNAFRREQTAMWDALDLWEPTPVSIDFNRRLWRRIDAAAQAPWYRSLGDSLRFANWKPVLTLTATILVIAAGFLLDHPGGGQAGKGTTPEVSVQGVSMTDADQLEQTLDDIQMLRQLDSAATPNGRNSKM